MFDDAELDEILDSLDDEEPSDLPYYGADEIDEDLENADYI